tara:strand:+ start:1254 stop:1463 length:210 start_codon:yes stop_codon:yes gene_type:complete
MFEQRSKGRIQLLIVTKAPAGLGSRVKHFGKELHECDVKLTGRRGDAMLESSGSSANNRGCCGVCCSVA